MRVGRTTTLNRSRATRTSTVYESHALGTPGTPSDANRSLGSHSPPHFSSCCRLPRLPRLHRARGRDRDKQRLETRAPPPDRPGKPLGRAARRRDKPVHHRPARRGPLLANPALPDSLEARRDKRDHPVSPAVHPVRAAGRGNQAPAARLRPPQHHAARNALKRSCSQSTDGHPRPTATAVATKPRAFRLETS